MLLKSAIRPAPTPAISPALREATPSAMWLGRYRVGEDKVRGWITRGELRAINTSAVLCGKRRWVIPPEALAEFEKRRAGGPPPAPARRHRRQAQVDFYPD